MESPVKPPQAKGLVRWWKAWLYTKKGLKAAYANEAAFREETIFACVLIPLALFLPLSLPMKAIMVASVLLVIIVELLNSAIEAVVDRISSEHHPLAGRAKDMGSAAVFVATANGLVMWGIGFFELIS